LHAQLFVEFTQSPSSIVTYTDLWNLSVNNIGQSGTQTYIELQLTEQNAGDIFSARTQNVTLNQGMALFSFENFRLASQKYGSSATASTFKTTGQLPEGLYTLCVTLKNPYDDYTFSQKCEGFSVTRESIRNTVNSQVPGGSKNFRFHGYAELTGYYTNRTANYTTLHGSYAQLILNPNLSVFDVPIGARFTLSTLQNSTLQNINNYSLYFDGDQFKNILKKKLLALIEKNNKLKDLNLSSLSGSMSQLKDLENTLKNPDVIRELGQIKELDSLKNIYSQLKDADLDALKRTGMDSLQNNGRTGKWNDSLNSLSDSLNGLKDSALDVKEQAMDPVNTLLSYRDSLQAKMDGISHHIKALEWLEQKKDGYKQLLARKEKLTEMGKKFGVIDSNGNMKDIGSLKESIDYNKLSDPGFLYNKLKSSKLLRKVDKILYGFKTFSIGTAAPNFSELTLKSVPVNGIVVEYEQKHFYAGFTYGELQAAVPVYDLTRATYRRTAVAGSFGYGQKEKTHFHINIFHAWDDSSSVQPRDSIFLYQKTPQINYVLSADFKVVLFKEKLRISGELAGSQTTRDFTYLDSSIINPVVTNNPGEWLTNIITQRPVSTNTAVDFAFNAKIEGVLFKGKTLLSASTKRVGAHFYAFGTPFLMRDIFSVEIKATQRFWKNRISLMAFVRRNNDNLDNNKPMESVFYNYGFDVALNIPKLPYLKASLMPVNLQNDSSSFNMTILNVASGYNYKVARRIVASTNVNYTYQESVSNDSLYRSSGHFVTLNQLFTFKNSVTLNITSGYFHTASDSLTKQVFNIGAGTGFTLFKKINTSVGGNVYMANTEFKWGAYGQVGITFLKLFTFSLRVESNQFNNFFNQLYNPDFLQFAGKGVLVARW
jgi:hypothetical protein